MSLVDHPIQYKLVVAQKQMALYRADHADGKSIVDYLISTGTQLVPALHDQLIELMEVRNPLCKGKRGLLQIAIKQHLGDTPESEYGVFVHYPWIDTIVHILPEDEFIEVRTNRNREKLTSEQIELFRTKKVGVIGLSVGQAVAITIAMERLVGEIRLADFDNLELSNMNRIRASLAQHGLPKVEIAKRAIQEMDPYIKVVVEPNGINEDNIEAFLTEGGPLDILIDECDNIAVKIRARIEARKMQIPVIMETSDRGMIDIERFDLSPDSHILDPLTVTPEEIEADPSSRSQALQEIIDFNNISSGMAISMPLIGSTLLSWPQLASEVTLGGATVATCCRLLFTNEHLTTGRRYIDVKQLIT